MAGMELNRPFLVIQIPFSFLKSPLGRIFSKKIHFFPLSFEEVSLPLEAHHSPPFPPFYRSDNSDNFLDISQ